AEESRGVNVVSPGAMRTCSQPSSRNAVHNRSAHATAAVNNASDIRGAIFFAPNATAKCPMNMLDMPPVIRTNARSIVPFVGLNLGLENFGGMWVAGSSLLDVGAFAPTSE